MRLKTFIFLGAVALLLIALQGSKTVFGANKGLSEAEITKQYGFTFPIGELGNCATITECGNYCKKDGNLPQCMAFVKKYQITKDDVLTFTVSELDNCQMGSDCRNFCNKDENITQCIDFADKYDLLSTSNIEIAHKFTRAVGAGGGPGGCKSLEQCNRYCDDSTHTNECLDYVGKKNLLPVEELNRVRKVAEGFRQGVETPGHCRDLTDCNLYCADSGHLNECAAYASKVGYFSGEQAAEAKKFSSFVSQGSTPGGCKAKDSCEGYCANAAHKGECSDFALSQGYLSKEDAEAIKKYGGAGPGGCKSKDECTTFCNQPANQDNCLQYAKAHNIDTGFKGPGGCQDQASCTSYCTDHQSDPECQKMAGQYGGGMPKGPGGCSDEASCTAYCKSNPKDSECAKFAGQYGGGSSDHQNQQQDQQQGQQQPPQPSQP